jgi:RNA polymerase sigma-70 factor (ECF subfamily)
MISNRETDQLLVRLAQSGNRPAFDTLVLRYRRRLLRHVLPLVRDEGEAEDVVQDAFFSAFNSLHHFRGDSEFSTWLYRIAINSAKHSLSQAKRRFPNISDFVNEDDREGMLHEQEMDFETPEAMLESQQILHLLNEAIENLPPEQREALMLREIEGLSYDSIAISMDCPIGTVRSRVHRARDGIAAYLHSKLDMGPSKH